MVTKLLWVIIIRFYHLLYVICKLHCPELGGNNFIYKVTTKIQNNMTRMTLIFMFIELMIICILCYCVHEVVFGYLNSHLCRCNEVIILYNASRFPCFNLLLVLLALLLYAEFVFIFLAFSLAIFRYFWLTNENESGVSYRLLISHNNVGISLPVLINLK